MVYGGGYGYGYGYGYPSSVLGSGYYGSYLYNAAGGYSGGKPTNPAFLAPELNDAQSKPLIEFPLYDGPPTDDRTREHRPSVFSDKWLHQTTAKEKTFDLLMTGTAMVVGAIIFTGVLHGLNPFRR
jgi:hypothetical protein